MGKSPKEKSSKQERNVEKNGGEDNHEQCREKSFHPNEKEWGESIR